ncbi:MAG TPA: SusC/RagA family TonB-linked outer membrane protein [Pseudosphingobacterium sp.]|nr:SusC/RagA family TonB-linked outer membrane protein [Pseudosphingobacterium sp.]
MYKKYLTWPSHAVSEHDINAKHLTHLARIFLLATLLCTSTYAFSQSLAEKTVSITFNNVSLEEAIKQLETRSNIKFVYNGQLLDKPGLLSRTFRNESLSNVLMQILQSYGIVYEVADNQYIILRNSVTANQDKQKSAAPPSVVQNGFVQFGVITDGNDEPIPGVSVRLNNASNVAQTDRYGQFSIGMASDETTLLFSYLGYKKISAKANRYDKLLVKMEQDPGKLDEVNIIGYGTSTRRTATGSQTVVSAEQFMNTPASNPAAALQGRTAGVYITQANGLPGSPMTFTIRGTNYMSPPGSSRNNPLFIVDGVPFLATAINEQTGNPLNAANGATSPLNSINPADIESISVLKDADATAIYGSRGANGVVLITTKKGKQGKTQFDALVKHGVSEVSHFVKLLTTEQYLAIRRKGYENTGVDPETDQAYDLTRWDPNGYTDFQQMLIGNTAKMTNANLALTGGDDRTNFRLSGTHHREGNVFVGDQGYKRSSANLNIMHKTQDQKFDLTLSAIYSTDENDISVLDQTNAAYNLPPNFPLYNADGSLYWGGNFFIPANPLGALNSVQSNNASNLISNLNLNYHIWKGLTFKTSLGFSRSDMDQKRLSPMSSMDPGVSWNVSRSMFAYNVTNNYIIEPQLTYATTIGKGQLNTLLGGTWQYQNSKQPYYTMASEFPSDEFLENLAAAQTVSTSSSSSQYKYASIFGRVNYNWQDKYIVNVNFRRDGSSRFGPDNRYGNFGSVGGAWVFSEESFVKQIPVISFGKLRASYGVLGSDQIGNYQYFDSYTSINYLYNGIAGMVPSRIANPSYRWEQTKKLEAAIDLGFLNDQISFSAAFYRNRSNNQLVSYPLSIQSGFTSYQANMPAEVENKGWEFTLSSQNLKTRDFRWSTDFNISFNSNKLRSFPDIERTPYYTQYQVGKPLTSLYAYQYTGFSPETGLPMVADLNGNGTINTGFSETGRGDRYYAGTSQPKYFGGLSNTFSYKQVTLDFLFQFVKQKGRTILSQSFYPPGYMYNAAAEPILEYINAGLPEQPQITSSFNEAYTAYGNYTGSDALLTDASFIRLKNVNLSYDFAGDWVKRMKLQRLRLQLQAQNLFTITDYLGFDPESQGVNLPPLRTIVGVIQFTF